jgi:hypothetical protein
MKRFVSIGAAGALAVVATSAGLSISADAATATFNANARIIPAILITNTADLEFADVIPDAVSAETVVIDTAGGRTCSGALLCSGTAGAASFDVTGAANATYAITLPGASNIMSGGDSMTVSGFTDSAGGVGTLSAVGTDSFTVGGTLSVGAAQPVGTYTGNFIMTVNYN